ncbi:MAG: class I SAM-dependent methyltransferase [Casimicrobiaceae bacterium]
MNDEPSRPLDAQALALFAAKGNVPGMAVPQSGEANGLKVRRILQLTRDLVGGPLAGVRLLDLGCGEGVYAIEAALHGADVLAIDARDARMAAGAACAARHGLGNVRFVREDVRGVGLATHGSFRVIYLLGLLYHLDASDVFQVLAQLRRLCTGFLLVDTLVATHPATTVDWEGRSYEGERVREHADDDAPAVRAQRVLRSIDNAHAFRFTRPALLRVLRDVGFTTVLECHVPLEPGKADDRVTLAAFAGHPVSLATYPWVNGASDAELARRARAGGDTDPPAERA